MPSVWKATKQEFNEWAQTRSDTGRMRKSTPQEIVDRGVVLDRIEGDVIYFHVGKPDWEIGEFPGLPISEGQNRRGATRMVRFSGES